MKLSDSDSDILAGGLEGAEQKLAESDTVVTVALTEADAARAQSPQAPEDLEALRRRLTAKEEQLRALHRELRERDERIAQLERLCAESAGAGSPPDRDNALENLTNRSAHVAALGLMLESLDKHHVVHRLTRVTTTIGRARDNDIAIDSTSASRYHARIVVASDSTYLIDLQSSNGCKVNGERISRQMIGDGDVIAIGDAKFKFSTGASLSETEDHSMDETRVLLDDSVIFTPAPTLTLEEPREQSSRNKPKAK